MKLSVRIIILTILLLVTMCTRFYSLTWGASYFFNPDERNIASSVSQLVFPSQMNPHFFAYGSLPIYTIYFLGVLLNATHQLYPVTTVTFPQAIIISRFLSALWACGIVLLVFQLGNLLRDERTGLLAAFFATISIGLTQYAHFGTFELWLTGETLLFFFALSAMRQQPSVKTITLLGLIAGALVATKVSTLPLILIAYGTLIWGIATLHKDWHFSKKESLRKGMLLGLLFTGVMILSYVVTNPYVLFDKTDFLGSISYEKAVAIGETHVFYTDEFLQTIPGVYQLLHVFPFLLSPILAFLWIPAMFYTLFTAPYKKKPGWILAFSVFVLTLFPQLVLYVKWTRYMVPTLPWIYLFLAVSCMQFFSRKRPLFFTSLFSFLAGIATCVSLLVWIAFFLTVYTKPDTRITAATWAKQTLSRESTMTSEPYDLGLLPFNEHFPHITLVNFYDLDQMQLSRTIQSIRSTSEAIILPSTRIERTRRVNSTLFPNGSRFYNELYAEKLGFIKAYQTPCDALCAVAYFGRPEDWYEETAFVFDHPTVTIFTRNEF